MISLQEFVEDHKLFVAGHRGSSGTAPENTLASYREAIAAGAKMIETDLRPSTDGVIMAMHDKKLGRTTDGQGKARDLSYDEIRALDAGSWFAPEYAGEKVPTLTEILDTIRNKIYLNLELKPYKQGDPGKMLGKICDTIDKMNMWQQVMASSFDYRILDMLRQFAPSMPLGAIKRPDLDLLPSQLAKRYGCQAYICSIDEINLEISDDAAANNIFIGVYSVDTIEQLDYVLQYDVIALASNFPGKIVSELNRRGQL